MEMVYLILLIAAIAIGLIVYAMQKSGGLPGGGIPVSNVLAHWSHTFKSFTMSSDKFYKELENTMVDHEMPHTLIARTKHKEAGILSASREYLRIKHGDIVFDVCAAPFGRDFFISWWLYETAGKMRTLLKNTKAGNFLNERASKRTFYQIDEEEMFRSCVHECILETIARVGEDKAMVMLSDADRVFKLGAF